jgi:hypothetical protein
VKIIATVVAGALAFVLAIAVLVTGPPGGAPPSATALSEIPSALLPVYTSAAETCPGLPWQVLAAIGFVESHHAQGRADPITGMVEPPITGPPLDGSHGTARIPDPTSPDGWAHAQGPMQFLPSTWARWGRLAPGRPAGGAPTRNNAWDAIYSAAAYLCGGRPALVDIDQAILSYNHSAEYLRAVLAKASEYGLGAGDSGVLNIRCPVLGQVSFADDWGDPRSGGRSHEGNDLTAPYGTALVAVEDGVIDQTTDSDVGLGGISVWLRGNSGTRYYYAHNSRNAVRRGQHVQAGEVVAYLGNTGNARDTAPHLHFEIHPGGGSAVDPFLSLSGPCATGP